MLEENLPTDALTCAGAPLLLRGPVAWLKIVKTLAGVYCSNLQRIPIATTNSWGRHSFLHGKKELFTKKVSDFEFLENHTQAHVPLTTRLESSMLPESNNGREGTRLCGIGMFLSSSSSSSSLSLSAPLRGRGLCGVAAKQRHDAIQFHLCMTCPNEA